MPPSRGALETPAGRVVAAHAHGEDDSSHRDHARDDGREDRPSRRRRALRWTFELDFGPQDDQGALGDWACPRAPRRDPVDHAARASVLDLHRETTSRPSHHGEQEGYGAQPRRRVTHRSVDGVAHVWRAKGREGILVQAHVELEALGGHIEQLRSRQSCRRPKPKGVTPSREHELLGCRSPGTSIDRELEPKPNATQAHGDHGERRTLGELGEARDERRWIASRIQDLGRIDHAGAHQGHIRRLGVPESPGDKGREQPALEEALFGGRPRGRVGSGEPRLDAGSRRRQIELLEEPGRLVELREARCRQLPARRDSDHLDAVGPDRTSEDLGELRRRLGASLDPHDGHPHRSLGHSRSRGAQ